MWIQHGILCLGFVKEHPAVSKPCADTWFLQTASFSGTCCSQFISKLELQNHPQPFALMLPLQLVGKAAHCSPVSVVYPHHISQCAVTESIPSLINNHL